jgi:hypothetical protein
MQMGRFIPIGYPQLSCGHDKTFLQAKTFTKKHIFFFDQTSFVKESLLVKTFFFKEKFKVITIIIKIEMLERRVEKRG